MTFTPAGQTLCATDTGEFTAINRLLPVVSKTQIVAELNFFRFLGYFTCELVNDTHGMDGGLPYWDTFQNNLTTASGSATGGDASLLLMLFGSDVPGHGSFDGRIGTIRMKGMRYGQQLAELLNLLSSQDGWNRNLVSRALSGGYGDLAGVGFDSYGGDEYEGPIGPKADSNGDSRIGMAEVLFL